MILAKKLLGCTANLHRYDKKPSSCDYGIFIGFLVVIYSVGCDAIKGEMTL